MSTAAIPPAPTPRSGPRPAVVILGLLLLTLLIRLPFFFPAVVNWDESTYILMGQTILDGHLPYTAQWEVKPPVGFLFYSAAIALFGHSIFAVRLAGALAVAAVGALVYLIGLRVWGWRAGLVGAVLTAALMTVLPGGQATMLEHVAVLPLVTALYLLVARPDGAARPPGAGVLLAVGALLAAAVLSRPNLFPLPLLVGLYLLVPFRPFGAAVRRGAALAAGGAAVVGLTLLPYALTGQTAVWWRAVVVAPLSWATGDATVLTSLRVQLNTLLWAARPSNVALAPEGMFVAVVWVAAGLGVVLAAARWGALSLAARRRLGWAFLFLVGAHLAVLVTGEFRSHYLIQVAPFMALFAGIGLSELLRAGPVRGVLGYGLAAVLIVTLLVALRPVAAEYGVMAAHARRGEPLAYGPAYDIVRYLDAAGDTAEPAYLMTDHIAYWLRGEMPLTLVTTHPSMVTKPELVAAFLDRPATAEGELADVLALRPGTIVLTPDLWYLDDFPIARARLQATLAADYTLAERIPVPGDATRLIYRRVRP
jgi:4-amino-4-deoxy-L-arabinose transferase-like glycosyltransferase